MDLTSPNTTPKHYRAYRTAPMHLAVSGHLMNLLTPIHQDFAFLRELCFPKLATYSPEYDR
jgi:hypothetical protein